MATSTVPRSTLTCDVPDFFRAELDEMNAQPKPPARIFALVRKVVEERPAVLTPAHRSSLTGILSGLLSHPWLARYVFDEYEHDTEIQDILQQVLAKQMRDQTIDLTTLCFVFGDHCFRIVNQLERRGLVTPQSKKTRRTTRKR